MKKLPLLILLPITLAVTPACAKKTDYYSYVSEYRHGVYVYEDDETSLKIYLSDKETPYVSDGIKGEMTSVCEVYYYSKNTPDEVEIELGGMGGEMSYLSVSQSFYLSFNCDKAFGAKTTVNLTADGKQREIEANSVAEEGAIDVATALNCVREYDAAQFEKLTDGNSFKGEISIRLLYDEGCYYYVGICNRDGDTHAYLLDAADGRIIAERETEG